MEYLSYDSSYIANKDVGIQAKWLTIEFLNEIKFSEHQIINWY